MALRNELSRSYQNLTTLSQADIFLKLYVLGQFEPLDEQIKQCDLDTLYVSLLDIDKNLISVFSEFHPDTKLPIDNAEKKYRQNIIISKKLKAAIILKLQADNPYPDIDIKDEDALYNCFREERDAASIEASQVAKQQYSNLNKAVDAKDKSTFMLELYCFATTTKTHLEKFLALQKQADLELILKEIEQNIAAKIAFLEKIFILKAEDIALIKEIKAENYTQAHNLLHNKSLKQPLTKETSNNIISATTNALCTDYPLTRAIQRMIAAFKQENTLDTQQDIAIPSTIDAAIAHLSTSTETISTDKAKQVQDIVDLVTALAKEESKKGDANTDEKLTTTIATVASAINEKQTTGSVTPETKQAFIKQTNAALKHPCIHWQRLGVAMMLLGISMLAIAIITLNPMIGVAGFGLFASGAFLRGYAIAKIADDKVTKKQYRSVMPASPNA